MGSIIVRLIKISGITGLVLTATLAGLIVWPQSDMPTPGIRADVLIQNVRVLEVHSGTMSEEQDVLIREGRIVVRAELFALAMRHVGQADQAGVKLLTGTDTFDTYVFP